MATAANIVLADAATTPINHTFVPNGKDAQGTYWFTDRSQANAVGYFRIAIKVKQPAPPKSGESAADRTYRVAWELHEPVLENITNSTISGIAPAPTVAYVQRSFHEYVLPERSTLRDRQDIWKMSHLLAANTQIQNLVENLDTFI